MKSRGSGDGVDTARRKQKKIAEVPAERRLDLQNGILDKREYRYEEEIF